MKKTFLTKKASTILMILLFAVSSLQIYSQTTYTWQGASGAPWTTAANWTPTRTTPASNDVLQFNLASTLTITAVPTETIGRFVMSNSAKITLNGATSVKILTIGDGTGTDLDIPSGCTLTTNTLVNLSLVANASASIAGTLTSNGPLSISGTVTNSGSLAGSGTKTFTSTSTYIHAMNGGTIPTAAWDPASICEVVGMISTFPSGVGQNFTILKWNCPGQTANGTFPAVTNYSYQTLEINSTGSGKLVLTGSATSKTLSIGSFSMTGGNLAFTSSTGNGILNVSGNFSHTAGTIEPVTGLGAGTGTIFFNGTSTQIFTSGGTINSSVNFTVATNAILQMASSTTTVSGTGLFTLNSGASLGITSADGIASNGLTGNIRTSSSNYNVGAKYIYNGAIDQNIGTGLPSSLTGVLTIDNPGNIVTLDNAKTIAPAGTISILNGTFNSGTNLTMSATSEISRSGGIMTGSPQGTDAYNVTYLGNDMSTTSELSGSGLSNITVNLTSGQTLTLDQNQIPDGNLTITSGNFEIGTNTIDRSSSGGTLTLGTLGILKIGGVSNFPANYSTLVIDGTIDYNGSNAITQAIHTIPAYYNLTLTNGSGSGTSEKTISANLEIYNNFTISTGCMFKIPAVLHVTVSGTLANDAGADGLVIQSTNSNTGSLIYNNTGVLGKVERFMIANKWQIISPPVIDETTQSFFSNNSNIATSGTNKGMVPYDPANNLWRATYFQTSENTPIKIGTGYLTRLTGTAGIDDGIVYFRGELNNSDPTEVSPIIYTEPNLYEWNCIGNPYTSAIGVTDLASTSENFLTYNATMLNSSYSALYIWNEDVPRVPGTKYYNIICNSLFFLPGGHERPVISQNYIQSGQGFLVRAIGSSLYFTKAMQVHDPSTTFYKKSTQTSWPGIRLTASYLDKKASTDIAFHENMTRGLDPTYDAGLLGGDPSFKTYSRLVEDNGVDFGIQCLPDTATEEMVIPIGIEMASGGSVSFSAETVPLPSGYQAVLEDRKLGILTDLGAIGTLYTTILDAGTTGTGRFFMHVVNASTEVKPIDISKIAIYAFEKYIYIQGNYKEGSQASVYDLSGRLLKVHYLENSSLNKLSANDLNEGVYVVRVSSEEQSKTERVFIK